MRDAILARARDGDKQAGKELFEYLRDRFKAFATRIIGEMDAEDISQEACLTVLQKYKGETFIKGFDAWAYGVLRMTIRNYMRSLLRRKKVLIPKSEAGLTIKASFQVPDYDLKRRLIDCLKQLYKRNPHYARVLNLKYQGYKTDKICQKLRIAAKSYYVILSRGRRLLKNCLEKGGI